MSEGYLISDPFEEIRKVRADEKQSANLFVLQRACTERSPIYDQLLAERVR